jgi:aminopeptidase N
VKRHPSVVCFAFDSFFVSFVLSRSFFSQEWKMWEQFVYSDLNSAFDLDSLENSHPIEVQVNHANEVDEM